MPLPEALPTDGDGTTGRQSFGFLALSVKDGWQRIRPVEFTCTTYNEVWPFDQPVHHWPECADVPTHSQHWGFDHNTDSASWIQGGASSGDIFHNEWIVPFKAEGDPTDSTLGVGENSESYKVYQSPEGWFSASMRGWW